MPQIKAAKKALRQSERRRQINDRWRRLVRESMYTFRDALKTGDAKGTAAAYKKAQSTIDRAARRNIIHRNRAGRLKSQLQTHLTKDSARA